MTLSVQFMTMISMILGGLYLGVALATFRRAAVIWKNNLFFTYFMEICFWFLQSFILFYILFRVNGGEIRVYSIVACLLGFAAYQALFSTLYRRVLEWLIRIVTAIYRWFVRLINGVIFRPIWLLIQFIMTCLFFLLKGVYVTLAFILKIVLSPVIWLLKQLFRRLPNNIQKILYKSTTFYSTIENTIKKMMQYLNHKGR